MRYSLACSTAIAAMAACSAPEGAGDRYHHGRAQRPRGKFEFSLDAPWRLEPHFRPGHPLEPEYDPVPIEISIFDEDQWHYDPVVIEPDGGVPIGDGAYVYDGC